MGNLVCRVLPIIGLLFMTMGYNPVVLFSAVLPESELKVLILHEPSCLTKAPGVLEAYQSVLAEEGVPCRTVVPADLLTRKPAEFVRAHPAIILPDSAARMLPSGLGPWVREYVTQGGNVLVVYDAGIHDSNGAIPGKSPFADMLGLDYTAPRSYLIGNQGKLQFKNAESARFFQIPAGKLDTENFLTVYGYGYSRFFLARIDASDTLKEECVHAYSIRDSGEKDPALVLTGLGKGALLYVSFPLGYMKSLGNDFPLRTVLRTLLFTVARIPHLVGTPYGKGGLVFNWHIDSKNDWTSLPYLAEKGFLRKGIEYSLHVTAGDSCDALDDHRGFDAAGRGRPLLLKLLPYGVLGSHGGWAHNWFYHSLVAGELDAAGEEKYIKMNIDCLEQIAGYKIVEYSAPNGVHPQPATTTILEKLGCIAYYYAGSLDSSPNRAFANGRMLSPNMIAFPFSSYNSTASLAEMKRMNRSREEVQKWLCSMVDYTVDNRVVRLIYTHPYDFTFYDRYYEKQFKAFLDHGEKMVSQGRLFMKSMSYFAKFQLRFLKTEYRFQAQDNSLLVTVRNIEGLQGITMAVPGNRYAAPQTTGLSVDEDKDYLYLTINDNVTEQQIPFAAR